MKFFIYIVSCVLFAACLDRRAGVDTHSVLFWVIYLPVCAVTHIIVYKDYDGIKEDTN
jgi:hypothetical protein